jgi:outer membrane protein assembly factor BamB
LTSAAVAHGRVYVGSDDGLVYCLDANTGAWIWETPISGAVTSSPAVVEGKVYVGAHNDKVYCLDAYSGDEIWEYEPTVDAGEYSSPSVTDGKVYIGSLSGRIYCLDADTDVEIGNLLWEYSTFSDSSVSHSSPAVADGKLYIGSQDSILYCLNTETNIRLRWTSFENGGDISSPVVADGKVYFSHWAAVFSLDANTGVWIWGDNEIYGGIVASPAVADGKVYIGTVDGDLYCLDAYTGATIWENTIGGFVVSPAVADNKVYIGSLDGNVYCLDANTGARIWDYFIEDEELSSPVVADGKIYITSESGSVYCIGTTLEERVDSLNARVSETEIKFMILPGERLNIYKQDNYTISADETTNVWHGFKSRSWDNYTEEQKTEYLSTAQWRFTVDGEEVPLDHVLRLQDGFMWSIYYRVFPPGYFKIGTRRLVGEWHSMENGAWDSKVREAKLRVK